MRVLVVDQDSASNLAITRSLRDLYTVDCVTNKGDCLDLLRSNAFEVIVATERLEDGSGLELLGQISKKWPSVLRIFAAERERLQLLRGRLGPFQLFQTLSYPIDPDKLLATLQMAAAAQSSDSQEVELPSEIPVAPEETPDAAETPSAAPFEVTALDAPLDLEQSDEFSEPRFARAGRAERMHTATSGRGVSVSPRVGSASAASSATSSAASVSSGAPRARRVESAHRENDLAAKFPGSGTFGPRRVAGGASGRGAGGEPQGRGRGGSARDGFSSAASRGGALRSVPSEFDSRGSSDVESSGAHSLNDGSNDAAPRTGAPRRGSSNRTSRSGRARSAGSKAPPVRFPPLERTPPLERNPPLERVPPLEPSQGRSAGGDFSEAAAMARAARSNYESSTEELDTKRLATLIGGGVAVAAIVIFLGFKVFSSKSDAPKPAPPVVAHAPEYPPEVMQLVAQTEAAFKADDFKAARADVERLRQLSPSHPRLDFFQGLLSAGGKSASSGRATGGSSKKNGAKGGGSPMPASKGDGSAPAVAKVETRGSSDVGSSGSASAAAPDAQPTMSSSESHGLAPETPVGFTRESVASAGGASLASGAAVADSGAGTGVGSASAMRGDTAADHFGSAGTGSAGGAGAAGTSAAGVTSAVGSASAVGGTSAASSAPESTAAATPTPASVQAPHTPATAPAARRGSGEPPPVVQEAKLIRRVNPDYPSAAKKDGVAGSVDLEITVSAQGAVENVSVVQATPPEMFDKSAVAAVRKWKYDPRFVDGLPSQAHLKVHLEFGPGK